MKNIFVILLLEHKLRLDLTPQWLSWQQASTRKRTAEFQFLQITLINQVGNLPFWFLCWQAPKFLTPLGVWLSTKRHPAKIEKHHNDEQSTSHLNFLHVCSACSTFRGLEIVVVTGNSFVDSEIAIKDHAGGEADVNRDHENCERTAIDI